jgi:hypothetical protein
MQLCQATKRGALDFVLSNFKWYILLTSIVKCSNGNGKHTGKGRIKIRINDNLKFKILRGGA